MSDTEFIFDRKQWNEIDLDQMIEWVVAFCKEGDLILEDVEETYYDPNLFTWGRRWTSVRFRFNDPKIAMAFKLAWGGNR